MAFCSEECLHLICELGYCDKEERKITIGNNIRVGHQEIIGNLIAGSPPGFLEGLAYV